MQQLQTEPSRAQAYVEQKAWAYRIVDDQLNLQVCPVCGKDNWHFYINFKGQKDGLNDCKVCGWTGNLFKLQEKLGDRVNGVMSMKDVAYAGRKPESLPDYLSAHRRLMEDGEALDYLVATRGYTMKAIEELKLGVEHDMGKKWLLIPYIQRGQLVYAKYRTLPPHGKDFRGISGREAPLYNQDVIEKGMDELIFVEGEGDAIALLSAGVKSVVGVPGANLKKAIWVTKVDEAAPKKIYILYDRDKVGQNAAREMAVRIGIEKVCNIVLPEFQTIDGKEGKDINEWLRVGHTIEEFEVLKAQAKPFDVAGVSNLIEVLDELEKDLEGRGTMAPTLDTPWESLTGKLGGCEWGDLIGIIAEGKVGKLQPLSAKVLTPAGWTTMGKLCVGHNIASVDGEPSVVTGIFPQGVKKQYKVTFSDGRSTRCGLEHLWKIGNVDNFIRDGYRVVTTEALISLLRGEGKWFVPLFDGNFSSNKELPLHPWLLGALLGDGGLTSGVKFSTIEPKMAAQVNSHLGAYACELVQIDELNYRIVGKNRGTNRVLDILRELGVWGKSSLNKYIPDVYLEGSRAQRLALLSGLMDTDGSLEGGYRVPCFNTPSIRLLRDVQSLVRSLGGIAPFTSRVPTYTHNKEKLKGQKAYRALIKLNEPVMLHSSKAYKEQLRAKNSRLKIVSVSEDGEEESRCITVSHSSKLYVTDDFIVTHNTTMALNWLDYYARLRLVKTANLPAEVATFPCLMFCQEMHPKRLVRKWMSLVTQTDDTPGKSQITKETVQMAKEIALSMPSDFLFGYTKVTRHEEVFDTIRQAVRRYGVKVVCFDNLQLLVRSIEHSAQETSRLTKDFKQLAMDLNIVILLIIQPNRVKDGEIVAARNAHGSSAIEKDVDAMIALHRNRKAKVKQEDFEAMKFMEADENFEPQLLVRVDLSRYAPGGVTTLWFDGATSTVREFKADEFTAPVFAMNGELPQERPLVEA